MATSSVTLPQDGAARASARTRFLAAGLTVALLDGLFAVVVYTLILQRASAGRIFQSVAAGLLGPASYQGGAATVALGLVCHVAVAFAWTTVYYLVSRNVDRIRQFASSNAGNIITGLIFGAVMWLGMAFIVLPLSAARPTPPTSWQFWLQFGWHIVGLGPPLVRILR